VLACVNMYSYQARTVTIAGRVARNHIGLGGTGFVAARQRLPGGTERMRRIGGPTVDFQSTAPEPLALLTRVVQ
jgi:hypothetical protein